MENTNKETQIELPLIGHIVESVSVNQRANDGYINATAMCQVSGKQLGHYLEGAGTRAFLSELSSDIGIPISGLVEIIKGGHPRLQGTWVHPQVAIHLGQWASPKFAVLVSKWVFDWMSGTASPSIVGVHSFPYHIRRYLVNRSKIPASHFSMLDQMTFKLLGALETKGYIIPDKLMPDIALGKMFCKWLREAGYDPDSFPTYAHEFGDGVRPTVQAKLYPNELMTDFNLQLEEWIESGKAHKYFESRDANALEPLKAVLAELPAVKSKAKQFGK